MLCGLRHFAGGELVRGLLETPMAPQVRVRTLPLALRFDLAALRETNVGNLRMAIVEMAIEAAFRIDTIVTPHKIDFIPDDRWNLKG
jgi:hypothetical protein